MRAEPVDPQEEVIAFLSRAATYGAERVEIVETHASIVFLAGERAYKLKKSVRYSYLDYSTVEARSAACAAELAVNRVFSPHLYLAVISIVRSAAGPLTMGPVEGPVVDSVLVMRRFDQEGQFDRMAERRELPLALMRRLADRIAEAHEQAEVRPSLGGREGLRKAIEITIENLRLAVGHGLDRGEVEQWSKGALRSLEALSPVLERRRMAGRVRACHGDLHLQNICLFEGHPTLFDAIEFDPAISSTDTLFDLAFLLMDLHHRGLEAHGNLVFNRYLDRRDESDGLAALPLFMSVRAGIRAQVSVAAARRHHEAGGTEGLVRQGQSYLGLALELLVASTPCLVAIGGLSGTGKSTLAYRIAPRLASAPGARVLRSDVIRKRAAGVSPETELPPEHYTGQAHAETYRRMMEEAKACLVAGRSVVADAVFAVQGERDVLARVARDAGCPFAGLWLEAPIDTLERRLRDRRDDASDARAEVLHVQTGWTEKPSDWRCLDAGGEPESVEAAALSALAVDRPEAD